MRRPGPFALAAAVAAALLLATAAPAQVGGDSPHPERARAWRPLAPLGELPRGAFTVPEIPELLLLPPPAPGAFWSAGNPAFLPDEIPGAWTSIALSATGTSGSYRRPLDPVRESGEALHILSWQPVSDRFAAAGEVQAGTLRPEPASFGRWTEPHRGTPFVFADTGRVDMRRLHVREEGAMGVRMGRWRAGLAAGYAAADTRTQASRFPRDGEWSAWGLTVGIGRELAGGRLRAGIHVRAQGESDEMLLFPAEAGGEARLLRGFAEPVRIDVTRTPLSRRLEREGLGGVASVAGTWAGTRWAAFAGHGRKREAQTSQVATPGDGTFEEWDTGRTRAGAALQGTLGPRLLITGRLGADFLEGEGRVPDIDEVVFETAKRRVEAEAELRLTPGSAGASYAAALTYRRTERERTDRFAEVREDVTLVRTAVAVSAARRLGPRLAVSTGVGVALHDAAGVIPNPLRGSGYRKLVAPEVLYDATAAAAFGLEGRATWRTGARSALWVGGRYGHAAARFDDAVTVPADRLRPEGGRGRWSLSLGIRIADRGVSTRAGP